MYVIDLQVSCKHHSFESVPIANGMRDAINNIKPTFHHGKNPAESHPPVVLGGELARFLKCWCLFIGYLYFFGNCHAIPGLVHQSQIHTLLDPRSISALVFFLHEANRTSKQFTTMNISSLSGQHSAMAWVNPLPNGLLCCPRLIPPPMSEIFRSWRAAEALLGCPSGGPSGPWHRQLYLVYSQSCLEWSDELRIFRWT